MACTALSFCFGFLSPPKRCIYIDIGANHRFVVCGLLYVYIDVH